MNARLSRFSLLVIGTLLAAAPAHAQKKQRDLVKRDEIMASAQREEDLFTALRSLRPRFLERPTGIRTIGNSMTLPTIVVMDGKRMGDLETLRSIIASTVDEVRYMEPSKATTEFGSAAGGGAVVVKLWKGPVEPQKVTKDSVPAKPR